MLVRCEKVEARSKESCLDSSNTSNALWEWREDLREEITLNVQHEQSIKYRKYLYLLLIFTCLVRYKGCVLVLHPSIFVFYCSCLFNSLFVLFACHLKR